MKTAGRYAIRFIVTGIILFSCFIFYTRLVNEKKILKEIISNLKAESRIAEVLVTGINYDEATGKRLTTIKFLEYDTKGEALRPRYFTFSGNIIQFQSLVIRFDDIHIEKKGRLKGRSAYIFWKVFMLDGPNTQEFELTKSYEIPGGYKIENTKNHFEERLWRGFWEYALDKTSAGGLGIKNAQIEAPGVMFIPGMLYTVKIEHDGGMRIDAAPLPAILRGEKIL